MTLQSSGTSLLGIGFIVLVYRTSLWTPLDRRPNLLLTEIHHVSLFISEISVSNISLFSFAVVNLEGAWNLEHILSNGMLCSLVLEVFALS